VVLNTKGDGFMAKLGNVYQLNQRDEDLNVYGSIHTFLLRKRQDSENTKITYERAIRDFFRTMRNKELEMLVPDDLVFTKKQIKTYQVALKEKYKGSTVNNTITAIRKCYSQLQDDGFSVEPSWFELERYDEHDTEKYDTLTYDEVKQCIALVLKTRKGKEKSLLIRLAYATAFRISSLLSMNWNQVVNIDGVWYAKVVGKGNKLSHKKLSPELYIALMEHKKNSKGDKVFELTKKTVDKMMKYLRENMDFGERKIVFHSFKKASLNEVNVLSGGDLKLIQAHGDHADVKTTLNDYIAKKQLEDLLIVDIDSEIPLEEFDTMTKLELIDLIKNMDRVTQIKLLQKAGKM
jgi:integrase